MTGINIGLIGTGFMGRAHAHAFHAVAVVFPEVVTPRLALLADVDAGVAGKAAADLSFASWTTDWRALVSDPGVDVVAITTPNFLHQEMALAAIAHHKHVYCEKPLALDAAGALAMAEAAATAGVKTLVGFNYLHNPATALAKELIADGEIGEVIQFQGVHAEDYMADPAAPASWRTRKATAGAGVIADLGSHITSLARHLVGEIEGVCGALRAVVPERPRAPGSDQMEPVEVEDQGEALLRFANGATGMIAANWMASGRKMNLAYEITGTKGTILFDQERMNELRLFTYGDRTRLDGFRTILSGPAHPPYAAFCPAPGHGLGFNDLKTIEVKALLDGIAGKGPLYPDFHEGWRIARVIDAIIRSAAEERWVRPDEI